MICKKNNKKCSEVELFECDFSCVQNNDLTKLEVTTCIQCGKEYTNIINNPNLKICGHCRTKNLAEWNLCIPKAVIKNRFTY